LPRGIEITRSTSGRPSPLGAIALLVLLVVAGWLVFEAISDRPAPAGSPAPTATGAAIGPGPDPAGTPAIPAQTPDLTPALDVTPLPAEPTTEPREMAIEFVPVADFWSSRRDVPLDGLLSALRGEATRGVGQVIVPADDRAALEQALGITLGPNVATGDVAQIEAAVRDGTIGLLRVADVTPVVRALSVDGRSLFGNERMADTADWPIRARVMEDSPAWDASAAWSLIAAGDILLDRGVANQVFANDRGVDFPYDGGTARINHIVCCSDYGWPVPSSEQTGNRGAVRELIQGGDLAIANLESAVVPNARIATSGGLRFHGRPQMLDGIAAAGFDYLSLANNHIGDAGEQGILNAMRELDERGIVHSGAGRRPAEARQPAVVQVNGQSVAIIACDAIAARYHVRADRVGSQSCRDERLVDEIRATRDITDVVIVFPHWGREYLVEPRPYQRQMARAWVDAGADVVIGAHSHWAGAIEQIDDRLVFYSLGNFVFDQAWQTETQLGVVIELTFQGSRLVQAWLHPTLILDQAQPNLLDPEGDAQRVIDQMRDGSRGLLP
jgi:poly-gamma-glutamate synthesis protein (capsule biosynthesis protein)